MWESVYTPFHSFILSFIHYCTKLCPHNRTDQGEVWFTGSDVKVVAHWQSVALQIRILSRCKVDTFVLLNGICLYFWLGVSNEAEVLGLQLLDWSDWSQLGLNSGNVSVASLNRQFLTARVDPWNLSHCDFTCNCVLRWYNEAGILRRVWISYTCWTVETPLRTHTHAICYLKSTFTT